LDKRIGEGERDWDTEGNAHADKENAGGLQCGRMQVTHTAINTYIEGRVRKKERREERRTRGSAI